MSLKELRQLAEEKLKQGHKPAVTKDLSEHDNPRLYHELRTHQIELELQNDELRRTQQALLESRDRYANLYHSAPVGYVTLSKDGSIIDANIKFSQMLDLAIAELIHKPFSNFVETEDQDSLYLLQRRLITANKNQSCELRLRDHAGEQHWVRIDCNATINNGDVTQVRASITDISSLKHTELLLKQSQSTLENRIAERTEDLEKAKVIAEQACQSKSDFLSYMSHELRTSMNSILGFAQLLEMKSENELKELATHIVSSGQYMLSLINDLLDLSMIESGKYNLDITSVDLPSVINDCLDVIESIAEQNQIEIMDYISSLGALRINADYRSLVQALINLMSNAVKYTPAGGKITLSCRNISGIRIRLCIEDNGPGIAEEDLENIFLPFYRLDNNISTEGTGIGLAITRKLVELMGCTIGVESTPGKGSNFWIEMDNLTLPDKPDKPDII